MRGLLMVLPVLVMLLFPTRGSVTTPAQRPSERADILRGVETNLLSLFGFTRRPRPDRRHIIVPPEMMRLYKQQTGQDLDTVSLPLPGKHTATANTVRSFTHDASPIDVKFPTHHVFRLSFDLSKIPRGEKLKAAELQLSRDPQPSTSQRHRIVVQDIVRPGIAGRREPILRVIDSKLVDVREGESVSLDVMPAVQRWLESPKHNHGLLIQVTGQNGETKHLSNHIRLKRDSQEEISTWYPKQPLLFTYTDDGKNVHRQMDAIVNRSKRAAPGLQSRKTKRKDGRENCRRHQLYVDFSDVGWNDWIVAPPGYDAYFCHGDCPFPLADHLNTTNHAIVQTLVNSVNPGAVPKACCVPTQLTPISMLYLDEENKVVLKNYQDMAVSGCGCR